MRVAVVGIGAVGSAACRFLADAGHTVVGFERFTIGHGLGSSHGESRIIRYAYPEAHYTKLMGQAYPLWDALEQAAGEELFVRCGGLTFGPKEHPELASTRRALEVNRVPHQLLRLEEISERFPAIQLFADEIAIWQSDAGFLRAGAIVRAQARLAEKSGAEMRENTVIESLTELSGFDHVIVCAGAWANTLFPESPLPLTVTRQQVTYLSGELVGYPVWIDMATYWYGFPSDGRIPGVKLARHVPAEVFDPDHPDRPTLESDDDAALAYAATRLPSLGPEIMHHASCLYTNTPDESFVFDHPRPKITRISACSGHGFKFSILMGRLAADAATNETPRGKPRSISRIEDWGTSTPERVEDIPKGERGKPRGIVPVRNKKPG